MAKQLLHWVSGPKARYILTLNCLPNRDRPEVRALVAASLPTIVRTMVDSDFFESWGSVVSNPVGQQR